MTYREPAARESEPTGRSADAKHWELSYWGLALIYGCFTTGVLVTADVRGLEGHIAKVRETWLEFGSPWSVALYLFMAAMNVYFIYRTWRVVKQ